jgi:chitin-binding protein
LTIESEKHGHPNFWTYILANELNRYSNSTGFRTGLLNANEEVEPNHGANNFYVRPNSSIASVILDVQQANPVTELELSGLQHSYTATDGKLDLHFNALVSGEESYTIGAKVIDQAGTELAYEEGPKGEPRPHFHIAMQGVAAGKYSVNVTAYNAKWEAKANTTHSFEVVGNGTPGPGPGPAPEHDFVYPQGLGQYAAGTTVLQPKDGNVYECKPWPYTGWCNVALNPADPAYEPGTGRAWQDAWVRK